ncbi:MAG: fluoride efflux transporter CrcB [Treponema sp.]|nr:fluoride efflux transporter CrcB [Treponema sp.]
MLNCIVVALGGAIGAVLRHLISLISVKEDFVYPIKTFAINVLGCFFIGLIAAISIRFSNMNEKYILFFKTGICGGFTTFSTFALESEKLLTSSHIGIAILYICLSLIFGLVSIICAEVLVNNILR